MNGSSGKVHDAATDNWVDRFAPDGLRPYARLMRLDRPIGWWLLLWPCWWSSALAAGAAGWPLPKLKHIVLFLIGAVVMRGAGCVWNDLMDRDIDGKVERTRSRPIPSGQVSENAAFAFGIGLALVGLLVLLQFNKPTVLTGVCSLALVALYPLAKRVTDWPQIMLGLAFSWGALVGWTAVFGHLSLPALLLYGASILWTMGYDTIYAHQDKEDDVLVGVRSTALLFRERTRSALAVLYSGAVVLMALAFASAKVGLAAYVGLALFALHVARQIRTVDIDDPDDCLKTFKSNTHAGWLLFGGLLADAVLRNAMHLAFL